MGFILIFMGILSSLVFANFSGIQSKSADTERKTDINAVHATLEAYYNENGYYPTKPALTALGTTHYSGLEEEALTDPSGKGFNSGGDYTYEPTKCDKNECQDYTLQAMLESEEPYIKKSLNGPGADSQILR